MITDKIYVVETEYWAIHNVPMKIERWLESWREYWEGYE